MGFYEYTHGIAGVPIVRWEGVEHCIDDTQHGFRISLSQYDDQTTILEYLDSFVHSPAAQETKALVIGIWSYDGDGPEDILQALVAANAALPNLESLFIGDILQEENEVSWINQADLGLLFTAYPKLKHLYIRGANSLRLGHIQHQNLETIVIQSGCLGGQIIHELVESTLPALQHLELWLGEENYGATVQIADLHPLLHNDLFPQLHYLGLRNSEIADEIAQALQNAPILEQLTTLDLSLGTLGNSGAQALLDNPAINKLETLNLTHHYMSLEMMHKIQAIKGLEIIIDNPQEEDSWGDETYRYISVGE